jgi:DNA-binding response OmpR family regulator
VSAGARPRATVLLVEAEAEPAEALLRELTADGYRVALARSAEHARVLAAHELPELALIGELPAPRGALSLLEEIRARGAEPWDAAVPVIVLGSRPDELELVRAFEAGADDFLVRPARVVELRARVRALLRRSELRGDGRRLLEVAGLTLDAGARTVTLGERPVRLRRREFDLLQHLAGEPRRAFTRRELLRAVWGYSAGSTRTVDTHASRVRVKLRQAGGGGRWIINVWGVGYRLTE